MWTRTSKGKPQNSCRGIMNAGTLSDLGRSTKGQWLRIFSETWEESWEIAAQLQSFKKVLWVQRRSLLLDKRLRVRGKWTIISICHELHISSLIATSCILLYPRISLHSPTETDYFWVQKILKGRISLKLKIKSLRSICYMNWLFAQVTDMFK